VFPICRECQTSLTNGQHRPEGECDRLRKMKEAGECRKKIIEGSCRRQTSVAIDRRLVTASLTLLEEENDSDDDNDDDDGNDDTRDSTTRDLLLALANLAGLALTRDQTLEVEGLGVRRSIWRAGGEAIEVGQGERGRRGFVGAEEAEREQQHEDAADGGDELGLHGCGGVG